jgi:hypothetical protein
VTWLCALCASLGGLLLVAGCVFAALRIVRMASDRDHAVGRHDTSEIEDVPTPRERRRRSWEGRCE